MAGSFIQGISDRRLCVEEVPRKVSRAVGNGLILILSGRTSTKTASPRCAKTVASLGLVLGQYHPVVADNVRRLRENSGLDEISFHMSGTEAVMQAVRLAR